MASFFSGSSYEGILGKTKSRWLQPEKSAIRMRTGSAITCCFVYRKRFCNGDSLTPVCALQMEAKKQKVNLYGHNRLWVKVLFRMNGFIYRLVSQTVGGIKVFFSPPPRSLILSAQTGLVATVNCVKRSSSNQTIAVDYLFMKETHLENILCNFVGIL